MSSTLPLEQQFSNYVSRSMQKAAQFQLEFNSPPSSLTVAKKRSRKPLLVAIKVHCSLVQS
jgi:hypothetical protein